MTINKTNACHGAGSLHHNELALAVTLAISCLPFSPVIAQEGDSARTLEEIVVVARRTEERAMDVPITVTVVGAEQIKAAQLNSGEDLIRVVPSLHAAQGTTGPGATTYAIRGISAGVVPYFSEIPSVGTTTDDQLWDLASVQTLSGPQGTLFGRNSTGGAILFVPQKPTERLEGFIDAGIGNYQESRLTAVVNVPLSDELRVRLGAKTLKRDGVVENIIGTDYQSQDRQAFRAAMTYEPSSRISNYTLLDYAERDEVGPLLISDDVQSTLGCFAGLGCFYNYESQIRPLAERQQQLGIRKIASNTPDSPFDETTAWGITNILSISSASGITLRYLFGYRYYDSDYFRSQTSLDLPIQVARQGTPESDAFTHELQLSGTEFDDRLDWTVGLFYSDTENEAFRSYALFNQPGQVYSYENNPTATDWGTRDTEAVYAQGSYKLTDRLSLTLGARYTEEKATLKTRSIGPQFTFFGPRTCLLVASPSVDRENCIRNLDDSFNATTYNIALDYKIGDDFLLYLTAREGFNGGGFNPGVRDDNRPGSPQPAYGPETLSDVELGFKGQGSWGNVPWRANVSLYQSKYEDMHRSARGINANGVPFIGTANAAEATINGAQIETSFKPLDRLQVNVNYGYLDPSYDKGTEVFNKDNEFARAPEHTVNASLSYSWPLVVGGEIVFYGGYTYQSEITFSDSNLGAPDDVFQDGYELIDARLGWNNVGGGPVDIGIYGKNLNDETYALDRQDNRNFLGFLGTHYNVPRTYGIELRYSFGEQ